MIRAPVSAVFAYLTEPETLHEWQASALYARLETDRPVRVGSQFVETRKFLGHRLESTMEIVEHDPPRRFALLVRDGPVAFAATHELSELADGETRLEWVVEGEPRGFFGLADSVVRRVAEREQRHYAETLKDILEARHPLTPRG